MTAYCLCTLKYNLNIFELLSSSANVHSVYYTKASFCPNHVIRMMLQTHLYLVEIESVMVYSMHV